MGLFDFLKKDKNTTNISNINSTSGGTTSVFKGDLAMVQDKKKDVENSVDKGLGSDIKPNSSESTDSTDSIVFMTFSEDIKVGWHCPECGTVSSDSYDGCVVCGIKK